MIGEADLGATKLVAPGRSQAAVWVLQASGQAWGVSEF